LSFAFVIDIEIMGVSSIILTSVRNHYIGLLFWLIAQFIFGTTLANKGKSVVAGNTLINLHGKLTDADIFYYHSWSGVFLLGFAGWGIFMKLYISFAGLPRPTIKNGFVSVHIGQHFIGMTLAFLLQYFTHAAGAKIMTQYTGASKNTLDSLHVYGAYFCLIQAVILTLEKLYFIFSRPRAKTPSVSKSPETKKLKKVQ